MFSFTRSIAPSAVALLMAAGLTAGVSAQGPGEGPRAGRGGHGLMDRAFARLDLTDTQRQQIREVHESHRDELRQAGARVHAAYQAQREAANAAPLDEARIRSTSQALADALTEVAVLHGRVHQQVLALLTPEQQEEAKKLRAERESRMKERGERGGRRHWRSRG
jgi:protein CpxP